MACPSQLLPLYSNKQRSHRNHENENSANAYFEIDEYTMIICSWAITLLFLLLLKSQCSKTPESDKNVFHAEEPAWLENIFLFVYFC